MRVAGGSSVSSPGPGGLLLFVAGDPDLAGRLALFPRSFSRMAAFLVPPGLLIARGTSATPPDPTAPWLIPADQMMCVDRLAQAVQGTGQTIKVVDVNRPADDRPLVEQWVGPEDILPILVRPDGARMEGAESFSPAALREFLRPA